MKKTFKQFQNDAKGLTDKEFSKLLDKKGIKRPNLLKKIKEATKRDEYGDPIGGPKISKKQLKKNLAKNEPDEQHTTTTSEGAAWTKKAGKNKEGGLNEKGRKSYERENPGSDLKRPQPEGGPRKKSFCARMGGVKGPMKKPNGEPTRKALALRKWKC